MNKILKKTVLGAFVVSAIAMAGSANAGCKDVNRGDLQAAIDEATETLTVGLGLPMWLTMVDESGKVCHVVTSGDTGKTVSNDKWLGSRVISAQKANTANAFSLDGASIASGALMAAVQPGGSLFGLSDSNPVDATKAYKGGINSFGTNGDSLKNKRIGGVNTFGGGLAIYQGGVKIGAIGVSGDTSCTDHATAWRARDTLGLAFAGAGDFETLNLTGGALAALKDHTDCGDGNANGQPGFAAP